MGVVYLLRDPERAAGTARVLKAVGDVLSSRNKASVELVQQPTTAAANPATPAAPPPAMPAAPPAASSYYDYNDYNNYAYYGQAQPAYGYYDAQPAVAASTEPRQISQPSQQTFQVPKAQQRPPTQQPQQWQEQPQAQPPQRGPQQPRAKPSSTTTVARTNYGSES